MQKIVCFGPGPKFKGGIANYNTALAKAFDQLGHHTTIVSWSQQYPAIIPREFVDKSTSTDYLDGTSIEVMYTLNYNNPLSWKKTVQTILDINPDKLIIQWAIAIQGLPLAYVVNQIRKRSNIKVIFDMHVVVQKEQSTLDKSLTRRALRNAHGFVTHAKKTSDELSELLQTDENDSIKQDLDILELYHPVYDLFTPEEHFDVEGFKNHYGLKEHVFLFFGFIRKYKGLHNVIEAFQLLEEQRDDVSLLICGESFWNTLDDSKWSTKLKNFIFNTLSNIMVSSKEHERNYRPLELIDQLGVKNVTVFNEYIPGEDVHHYFQASDSVVLFYETATPSGVESLAYNFSKPILATDVGHFPDAIQEGINGYLADHSSIQSMVDVMSLSIEEPIPNDRVANFAKDLSWKNYAKAITKHFN